ncbi:glycine zipper family protein [Pseudopelagicola sp. nBUS_19]|uniref:glycine zipper family protein n=1 Tax=unclassified Pseudopelagicola TaxID=2649563 RepID=UPI003EBAFF29
MLRFSPFLTLPLVVAIAACANSGANYTPVVDGPVGVSYQSDLAACQSLAASQGALDSNAGGTTAASAGVAAVGAAVFNNTGNNVRDAAAVGALVGLTASALEQNSNKESIVRNCMRQRGHNVVG